MSLIACCVSPLLLKFYSTFQPQIFLNLFFLIFQSNWALLFLRSFKRIKKCVKLKRLILLNNYFVYQFAIVVDRYFQIIIPRHFVHGLSALQWDRIRRSFQIRIAFSFEHGLYLDTTSVSIIVQSLLAILLKILISLEVEILI